MTTTETKVKLVNKEDIISTCSIINAMDCEEVLRFTTVNSSQEKCLSLQYIEYGECGFERKSDWMRFVNKLNSYDDTPIKRIITGNKKSLDWGGALISRADIDYSEDGFLIEFKEPTQIILEKIGDKYLVAEITKLRGKTTWEWYFRRKEHEDLDNICGICEVFIYDVEILE
jgi:hypothetical protein